MPKNILTSYTFNSGGNTITNAAAAVIPLTIKGAASQTANLLEIRNSSNTLLSYTLSNGDWVMPNLFNSYAGVGTGYSDYQGGATSLYVRPTATTRSGAIIKGLASQTANLQEWQNSSGTVLASVTNVGDINTPNGAVFIGSGYLDAKLSINTQLASQKGIVVRGASSQTADLHQWQNSSGTVLSRIAADGSWVMGADSTKSFISAASGRLQIVSSNTTSPVAIFKTAASALEDVLEFQNSAGTIIGGFNVNSQIFSGSTAPLTTSTGGATTAASGTGTTATITTTSNHNLAVGDRVTVAGVTPTGYNGTFILTAVTSNTLSYANATTGSQTVAGTVRVDAQASMTSRSAATVGLIVRGAASQASNVFEVQNSSGTVLASVASNATFLINGIGVTVGDHRVGTNNYYTAALNVFARSVTEKGIALRANNTGQNANMIEVQSSAGTVVSGTSPNGQLFTGTTEPIRFFTGGATTATSGTGSVATITTTSVHNLATGDRVTVAGVTPTGYNGTFIVTSTPTTSSFTYANATTGSQTVAGTVAVSAQTSIVARSAATVPLVLRAAVSQGVRMFDIQGSGGSSVFNIDAAGSITATNLTITGGAIIATGGQTSIGVAASRNVFLNAAAGSFGGGAGVNFIGNATTAPTSNPTGGGVLYVNAGALQYRGTSGNAATIVNADGTMAGGGGYTLPTATSTVLGGIELFSDTQQSVAANAVTATASRTYGIQLNSDGQAVVNVPWVDTDTNTFPTTWTWTAGTTAGPTASITGTSSTISVASIPAANNTTASGIVTTGAQTFGGVKTMTSPSITTSLTTTSTSFDLLDTTATTINFGRAASTLNIGKTGAGNTVAFGNRVTVAGNFEVGGGNGNTGLTVDDTGGVLTDGAISASLTVTGGNLTTSGTLTRTALVGGGTTGASINTSGQFIRTTSSERYKQDIQDAEFVYEDVLALSPKTFRLKDEAEVDPNSRVYGGLIAEDVDQIESLKVFVNYKTEEDGSVIPDGIAYGEMVSALVSAIKHQDARIQALEAQVQALSE